MHVYKPEKKIVYLKGKKLQQDIAFSSDLITFTFLSAVINIFIFLHCLLSNLSSGVPHLSRPLSLAFLAPHHLSMPIYFPPCPAPSYPDPHLSSLPCIPRACNSGRSAGIIVQVYVETPNLSPFLLQFGLQAVYYVGKRIFIHITPA